MVRIFDRKNNRIYEDKQYGASYLSFLYKTIPGRVLLKLIVNPIFSRINGWYNNTSMSKKKIRGFIETQNIDMSQYEDVEYTCFNQFFARKKKNIDIERDKNIFIAPADSKLMVYKIDSELRMKIKNSTYSLSELLNTEKYLDEFAEGNCMVFRLSVDDYHRYCFIDDGRVIGSKHIKGVLHTVSSISEKYKVYSQNSRVCSKLATANFGNIIVVEVGALLVGKIKNHDIRKFNKGDEKGYFEYGGSTIVVLTKNILNIDKDILVNSKNNIETKVGIGERIGELKC